MTELGHWKRVSDSLQWQIHGVTSQGTNVPAVFGGVGLSGKNTQSHSCWLPGIATIQWAQIRKNSRLEAMTGKTDEPTILFCFVSSESSVHVNINLNADMLLLENVLLISKGLMVVLKKCCSSTCNRTKQTLPFIRFNCYLLASFFRLWAPGSRATFYSSISFTVFI